MPEARLADPFRKLKVDKGSSTPAYLQIAEMLSRMLREHVLPPGYPLPAERALCDQFGVSRMTLRQAMGILEREGLILSQRGRGTFVAHDLLRRQQQELRSFTEEILSRGGVPESRLLSFELVAPSEEGRNFFGIPSDEKVYEIKRVRLSDGFPLAHETVHFPESICPKLDRFDLSRNSLYRILEESYGIQIETCVEEISAEMATAEQRRLLDVPRNVAVLVINRKTYTEFGRPIELGRSAYRGDRYSAVVHSVRKRRIS